MNKIKFLYHFVSTRSHVRDFCFSVTELVSHDLYAATNVLFCFSSALEGIFPQAKKTDDGVKFYSLVDYRYEIGFPLLPVHSHDRNHNKNRPST